MTHWTDNAPSPVFDTEIDATGRHGNIFAILGAAAALLRQSKVPAYRIDKMYADVTAAGSYDEAVKIIERWYRVIR